MARYIDADEALKIIDSYAKTVTADGKVVVDAIRDIVGVITPTADVAPRAEVAREIFEEIEKYAELQIESLNIVEKVDLSGAAFFGGGKQAFVLLLDRLAELKKKYMEEKK